MLVICKEDVLAFIEIVRSIPGMDKIQMQILGILERDSGKIWPLDLKQKCANKDIPLEEIWKEILKSPNNPNSY